MSVYIEIKKCDECPHYEEEYFDEYHGCLYIPAFCKLIGYEHGIIKSGDSNKILKQCPLLKNVKNNKK